MSSHDLASLNLLKIRNSWPQKLIKWSEYSIPRLHIPQCFEIFSAYFFPFLFWAAQGLVVQVEQTCKRPNFRNYWSPDWCQRKMGWCIPVLPVKVHTDTSMHESYSFIGWTVLFPGSKASSGSSRGFISRAKVKTIKYSIVIILGEWKPHSW